MFIRTERLFLRPGWPEDLKDILAALHDGVVQPSSGSAMVPDMTDDLGRYLQQPRDPLLPHLFMYLRGDAGAQLVGGIGLERDDEDIEVGYWIGATYRGRGFAVEALRAVISQAHLLGHRRIVARHFPKSSETTSGLEAALL